MKTLPRVFQRLIVTVSVLAMVAIWTVSANADGPGRFTTIDYPGAVLTQALGINPRGDIVGSYVDSGNVEHGFLLRNGAFTSFDYPTAVWTEGWGISPSGDIVGQYGLPDKTTHGFRLRKGTFTAIDVPNQPNTMPAKINADGTIVGCYHVNNSNGGTNVNTMYGFAMAPGGVITSHPMVRTMNNGVNPQGDIVGFYNDPATGRALWSYLIHDGIISWFQFSATDLVTQAWDISPSGDIVGFRRDAAGLFHALLMVRGAMTSFDVEGATQTRAFGINASGDIVGYYVKAGVTHGFLLSRSLFAGNPIDDSSFFVTQNYRDFLNRDPDWSGQDFWTSQITQCGIDQQCVVAKRVSVSAAFFVSTEFQNTGYLVERFYKVAYGDATGTSTNGAAHQLLVPAVRFNEFLPDTQRIGRGVVVRQPGWDVQLESNKQAFANDFVHRSRFNSVFPTSMTPPQFVDKLDQNAGYVLSSAERATAIGLFGSATDISNAAVCAQVLRQVAEDQDLYNAEFNRAFVLMQYFGYLRRDPNDVQDTDYTGWEFWLTKLNAFNGDYIKAEMAKAFITSGEYRQRFGL